MPATVPPSATENVAGPDMPVSFDTVYEQLKKLASRQLTHGARNTLDTTALVHEVYLRLDGGRELAFEHPGQFFSYAARAMRHILVDRARGRMRQKAGGDWVKVTFTANAEAQPAIESAEQALALEQSNPRLDKPLWRLLIGNLGMAYGMTRDISRAKSTFEYGLSQDPANTTFHYNLARMYAEMNDREKAMQSLRRAFNNSLHGNAGERPPDPRQDQFFTRCMLDPIFRTFAESLMQPAI